MGFLLAGGCKSAPSSFAELEPETLLKKTSILLYPEQGEGSPRFSLILSLLDFPGDPELGRLASALFYEGDAPRVYGDKLIERYRKEYREAYRVEPSAGAGGEFGASMDWEYAEAMDVEAPVRGSPLAVLSRTREYYLGGAHGMRETKFAVIDTAGHEALGLGDFFKAGWEPALRNRMEAELRRFAGLQPGAPLSEGGFFEDRVKVPGNFFITAEGLGFHWNPYEIGPYAMGPVEIVLSRGEIRNLLSPRGLSLMGKKP
jgi:hypothetical protein